VRYILERGFLILHVCRPKPVPTDLTLYTNQEPNFLYDFVAEFARHILRQVKSWTNYAEGMFSTPLQR
jgi:hypothetical protein